MSRLHGLELAQFELTANLIEYSYCRLFNPVCPGPIWAGEGAYLPPLCILGLVWVRVPILFGNDLGWYTISKGFIKFGFLEPSKELFDFWKFLLVERCFNPVCKGPALSSPKRSVLPFSKLIIGKSQVFSACSYVYLHGCTQIRERGAQCAPRRS